MNIENIQMQNAISAALVADAHSLSTHWVYELEKIDAAKLDFLQLNDTLSQFHGEKKAGEQTHYGDQIVHLLQFIAEHKTYDKAAFVQSWRAFQESYSDYKDHSTALTIKLLKEGSSPAEVHSASGDMSGVVLGLPLLYLALQDMSKAKELIHNRIAITHDTPIVHAAVDWVLAMIERVVQGEDLYYAVSESVTGADPLIVPLLTKAIEVQNKAPRDALESFGKGCAVETNLPAVAYFLLKYRNDFTRVVIENTMCGGDNASRAIAMAFISGVSPDFSVPSQWFSSLQYTGVNKLAIPSS